MEPFSRKSSFKAIIYRSLRLPKKPKPPKPAPMKEPTVFLIKQASYDNLQILKSIQEERTTPMFPIKTTSIKPCTLVKFLARADVKAYDKDCKLTSFERKRRSQKLFVTGHHAHEQLFCPEQASQIEMHFTSSCSSDVILQVQAPNGEFSNYLYPVRNQTVFFNPTKVGCGHGIWKVDIAVRNGCRFRYVRTEEVYLKGQGMIVYNVEPNASLRLKEKLWLNWLN